MNPSRPFANIRRRGSCLPACLPVVVLYMIFICVCLKYCVPVCPAPLCTFEKTAVVKMRARAPMRELRVRSEGPRGGIVVKREVQFNLASDGHFLMSLVPNEGHNHAVQVEEEQNEMETELSERFLECAQIG